MVTRFGSHREAPPLVAVMVSKCLKTVSLFWAYGVLQHLPLAVFLLAIKARSIPISNLVWHCLTIRVLGSSQETLA